MWTGICDSVMESRGTNTHTHTHTHGEVMADQPDIIIKNKR
jgi:hypothetical protein